MAERAPVVARGLHRVEHVMGMPISVDMRDEGIDAAVLDGLFEWLRFIDATFSTYRLDSEISRLNARTLARADAHPLVRGVLARCEDLRAATGGAFDAEAAVPGVLDPSGLVKGWSVERAAAMLELAGARRYAINAAGDVRLGAPPQPGGAWRVGIRHPLLPDRLAAVLAVHDCAVATSGGYERGGQVVDPRTRRPPHGVLSVTVVGPDLGTADAYATAAYAMGEDGPQWTARLAGHQALTILADGTLHSTAGIERLRVPLTRRA